MRLEFGKFIIENDPMNLILKERVKTEKRDGTKGEREDVLGYFRDMGQLLRFTQQEALFRNLEGVSTLEELSEAYEMSLVQNDELGRFTYRYLMELEENQK